MCIADNLNQLQLLHLLQCAVCRFQCTISTQTRQMQSGSSPNSPGASHTSELTKCQASDKSRQMPNLNLMPDPIILGSLAFGLEKCRQRKKILHPNK